MNGWKRIEKTLSENEKNNVADVFDVDKTISEDLRSIYKPF